MEHEACRLIARACRPTPYAHALASLGNVAEAPTAMGVVGAVAVGAMAVGVVGAGGVPKQKRVCVQIVFNIYLVNEIC